MALKQIGALWEKKGRSGTFYSGNIEIDGQETNILVFKNKYKEEGDNKPSLIIHISVDDEEQPPIDDTPTEDDVPF